MKYFKIFTVRDKRQMKPIPFQSSWQKFSRNKSSVTLSFSDSENSEGIRWNPGKGNFIGHIILPPIKGPKNFPFQSQKFTQTVKSSMVPSKFAHNVPKKVNAKWIIIIGHLLPGITFFLRPQTETSYMGTSMAARSSVPSHH